MKPFGWLTQIKALSAGLLAIIGIALSSHQALAIDQCSAAFLGKPDATLTPTRGQQTHLDAIPSLYIDRTLVSKGEWTRLNGKQVRILNYFSSASGDVIVVQTKKGKTKILNANEISSNLVVIDHVRLSELLSYKNSRVTERFMRDHGVSEAHAERTFQELMKWFFVLHRYTSEGLYDPSNPNHFTLGMYNETHAIDEMWHEFILFTIDYHEFGHQLLGYYQHHQPFDREVPKTRAQKIEDRLKMYDYIRETLGTETLRDWFVDMKFTDTKKPVDFHVEVPARLLEP